MYLTIGFYDLKSLMEFRRSFFRLVELMQPMKGRRYFGGLAQGLHPGQGQE
jgi:hypothetical protein